MWVMIYWVCMAGCATQQLSGFSTEELCKAAAERVVEKNDKFPKSGRAEAVCVNADMNMFE